ncbi:MULTISPECIES: hypothetical protein [unclassified Rhodococcus (in: high G+C Gram-positive bacteria)]|uniref:hypothetical protein n=1 Tax=unclassified Rhodococcus (in: high G+C Gram-positive bacteria) TaxID=192944 RepID=UPI002016708A|nr:MULTISPECIES: hypothetical protein [unclassified Rhodococcus (in: high G+C Gram-positive bacteria)]
MAREHHGSSIVSATGPSRSPRRPQPPRAASGSRDGSRRRAALLFGGAAVTVAAILTGVIVATGDDPQPAQGPLPADALITSAPSTYTEQSPSESSPTSAPAESAQGDCSMPAGGQDSGENAIRAFEYRLYVERSGAAAFELLSPAAPPFTSVANLDAGIAATPVGSMYCLDLDPVLPGLFTLTVSLVQPDGTPGPKYRTQRVTTSVVDGRHLIESITEVGE